MPDSPLTLMAEIDAEQRHELELMIRELETENANLQVRTFKVCKWEIKNNHLMNRFYC